jgi:DNA-binding NarL/FixJ family response regulator
MRHIVPRRPVTSNRYQAHDSWDQQRASEDELSHSGKSRPRNQRQHRHTQQQQSHLNSSKSTLTKREAGVVRLVSSNKTVAKKLGIEEGTVKIHLNKTYRKLGIRNRLDLMRIAIGERDK